MDGDLQAGRVQAAEENLLAVDHEVLGVPRVGVCARVSDKERIVARGEVEPEAVTTAHL